jgi:hypothetical protein
MPLYGYAVTDKAHSYQMGPFCYRTTFPIPELPPAEDDHLPVIAVSLGPVPTGLSQPAISTIHCQVSADEFLLRIPGVAGYYARLGAEVLIEPDPRAAELDVRAFLLGNIFAALCHQRGLLPLHASSIRTAAGVVAFLGDSGAGKSSLAAFLARRGYPVVSDDICLIDPSAPLARRVLPVAPWLKLWRSTMEALGEQPDPEMRTFSEDDKFRFRQPHDSAPLPFAEVLVLTTTESDGTVFSALTPARAVQSMLQFTYQSWLVHGTGQTASYFQRCGQALEGVRALTMARPWGFASMEDTLDALEAHLRERAPGERAPAPEFHS